MDIAKKVNWSLGLRHTQVLLYIRIAFVSSVKKAEYSNVYRFFMLLHWIYNLNKNRFIYIPVCRCFLIRLWLFVSGSNPDEKETACLEIEFDRFAFPVVHPQEYEYEELAHFLTTKERRSHLLVSFFFILRKQVSKDYLEGWRCVLYI